MDPVFACDMTAMNPTQRARHHELAAVLRPAIAGTEELADGYAARFDTPRALDAFRSTKS